MSNDHYYIPDYEAMGDCLICGSPEDAEWHRSIGKPANQSSELPLIDDAPGWRSAWPREYNGMRLPAHPWVENMFLPGSDCGYTLTLWDEHGVMVWGCISDRWASNHKPVPYLITELSL